MATIFQKGLFSHSVKNLCTFFFQVSKACTSICQWVRAMHKYHFVAKAVAPKRVNIDLQLSLLFYQCQLRMFGGKYSHVDDG